MSISEGGEWIVVIDGERFFPTACLRFTPFGGLQQLVWNNHPETNERQSRWAAVVERPTVGFWVKQPGVLTKRSGAGP